VKINSDEQHATFERELQCALKLNVGFSNIYCNLQQFLLHVKSLPFKHRIIIKIKLTVSSFYITITVIWF